ncbi:BON domain-containing protein [Candidatus Kaiserbacteria bacterium]|nr:BON domain-containing protein [Candidatus Kaiserbacteria bacterium]
MSLDQLPDFAEADRDLLLRVKGFLHQRGYGPHRTLAITVERGVVLVRGRVPTYYLRQVAVECIRRVAGVNQFIDRIEVVYRPDDCPVNECSVCDPKTSTKSTDPRADLSDMARAAQRGSQSPFQRRRLFTTAKG